jgi:hypothetical protein
MNDIFEFPEAKSIVVSGDIHGEFTQLVFKCCIQYGMTDTLIIVAGDCGFGFERSGYYENLYARCSKKFSKANNWLVFLRGNHDNPAYFNLHPIHHSRWMTLPDYSVIKACGHIILCVGGATSVDRSLRIASMQYHHLDPESPLSPNIYWMNESPFFDQEKLEEIDKTHIIDTMITHTAPSFCELTSHQGLYNWAIQDESLMSDVKRERQVMDKLHTHLLTKGHPLRHWFYGHFHQSWNAEIDGVIYDMLDIMDLREIPL